MRFDILIKTLHRPFLCLCVCVTPKCHARDMHLYLGVGWRNWSQSFDKWQVWSLTTHWNHFGFLISISGVRKVLQSQQGFLIFFTKNVITFLDVSRCFERFVNFLFLFRDNFWKKLLAKCWKSWFIFLHFRFLSGQDRGKDPKEGRSPKTGAKPLPSTAACRA